MISIVRAARSIRIRDDLRHEFRRRRRGEPSLPGGPIRSVVVICHGNICRSPFAGLDLAARNAHLEVRTAGLAAGSGSPPEPGALRVARKIGLELDGHRSKPLTDEDVEWADLILGMQGRHSVEIRRRWPQSVHKVRLLGDFLPRRPYAIEDPWGEEDAVFYTVFTRIIQANGRISELLRENSS